MESKTVAYDTEISEQLRMLTEQITPAVAGTGGYSSLPR